ncbi:MAG: hypothetical protein MUF23_13470 [Pirellula sp.]|nr:hypothetical protein [Pirellula sp.]
MARSTTLGRFIERYCVLTWFAVLLMIPIAAAQGPEGFRPQAPADLPSSGRGLGETGRSELPTPPRSTQRTGRSNPRDSYVRLARAPNMFGDTLPPLVTFRPGEQTGLPSPTFSTALSGGASYNISENNTAIPTDRVYFLYNAFYNAFDTESPNFSFPFNPTQNSIDMHRYLVGFEKTFFNGDFSIDFRMPLFSGLELQGSDFTTSTGNVGNLAVYLKGLLYIDNEVAVATGMGIGLPTGSDVQMNSPASSLTIENESVRLMPFVAMTAALNDYWFLQSFSQLNFAASGNDVIGSQGQYGVFTEQNLLQFDLGGGRWLYREGVSGVAGIVELHYTTTIQDADAVFIPQFDRFGGEVTVNSNRLDLLNLTSGLHFQFGTRSNLRVGAVAPLRNQPDRVFDSELQVMFNRFF